MTPLHELLAEHRELLKARQAELSKDSTLYRREWDEDEGESGGWILRQTPLRDKLRALTKLIESLGSGPLTTTRPIPEQFQFTHKPLDKQALSGIINGNE